MMDNAEAKILAADPFRTGEFESLTSAERASIWRSISTGMRYGPPPSKSRLKSAVALIVAASAATVAAIVTLATLGSQPANAAAELKAIGAAAGAVPTAATSPSEWLHRRYDANIVNSLTPTSTPTSSTTGSIDVWVSGDQACQTGSFGSVDFASPAARSAWVGAGLSPDPVDPPPIGWCSSGSSTYYGQTHPGSTLESGVGVIDVSGLPTDPTTLADELSAGTTGIAGLDSAGTGPNDPNPGFTRAVLLLVVPTIGDSPSFQEALLNALALMPNIQSLGRVVTHTGETGDGFSASAAAGSPAIILDPSTGVLLELRDSSSLMGLWTGLFLQTYLGTSQQGNEFTPQVIAELSPSIAWLDPIGPATSVASNDVPTLPNRIEF